MHRPFVILACVVGAVSLLGAQCAAEAPNGDNANSCNPIDKIVFASLQQQGSISSEQSSDTEFLRRLSLTTIGQLPTPAEVRAFVADERSDKRELKIDELLSHDLHAAVWASNFCDLTGSSNETLAATDDEKTDLAQMWHEWLRVRFSRNQPYDELARAIITATNYRRDLGRMMQSSHYGTVLVASVDGEWQYFKLSFHVDP